MNSPIKIVLSSLFVSVLMTACGTVEEITGNSPIIDTRGVDMRLYDDDLTDCQEYAEEVQIAAKTASSAATGAVVGGVFGAVVGNSETAKQGAGAGAVTGTLSGVSAGVSERKQVIRNCLNGRGYLVLN